MFSFGREVHSYWQSFIRLVYPASCPVCKIPLLLYEPYLCSSCALKIKAVNGPKCTKCARMMPPYGLPRTMCPVCSAQRPFYHRGFALVKYESPIKTLFHEIKFQNKPWLLKVFSGLLAGFMNSFSGFQAYDLLIPIPLDRQKARERGFNQAELIARMLKASYETVIPERISARANARSTFREELDVLLRKCRESKRIDPRLKIAGMTQFGKVKICPIIQKKKKTPPQSQLRRRERLNNLNGAFSIKKSDQVKGKHVLLVDDIFTTGSTINECARLLRENGAERVDFFTLARS